MSTSLSPVFGLEEERVCVCVCVSPPWLRSVARRQSAIRKLSAELEPDRFHRNLDPRGLLFGDLFRIKEEYTRLGKEGREGA